MILMRGPLGYGPLVCHPWPRPTPVPWSPLSLFVLGRNFHSFTPIHSSHIGLYDLTPALCIAPKMNSQV